MILNLSIFFFLYFFKSLAKLPGICLLFSVYWFELFRSSRVLPQSEIQSAAEIKEDGMSEKVEHFRRKVEMKEYWRLGEEHRNDLRLSIYRRRKGMIQDWFYHESITEINWRYFYRSSAKTLDKVQILLRRLIFEDTELLIVFNCRKNVCHSWLKHTDHGRNINEANIAL